MNERDSYLVVAAAFLVPALLAYLLIPPRPRGRDALTVLITVGVTGALTAVFDSLMIATGLFTYSPDRISGVRIGLAPIEDFAYPIAAALVCTALWRRATTSDDHPAEEGPR